MVFLNWFALDGHVGHFHSFVADAYRVLGYGTGHDAGPDGIQLRSAGVKAGDYDLALHVHFNDSVDHADGGALSTAEESFLGWDGPG